MNVILLPVEDVATEKEVRRYLDKLSDEQTSTMLRRLDYMKGGYCTIDMLLMIRQEARLNLALMWAGLPDRYAGPHTLPTKQEFEEMFAPTWLKLRELEKQLLTKVKSLLKGRTDG